MISTKTLLALLGIALAGSLASGCSSDSASLTSTIDTAPPAVPTNMMATYSEGLDVVKVAWAPNLVDADFSGFKLSRVSGDQTTPLLSHPADVTAFLDQNPPSGYSTYYISSVDQSGNESAFSTVVVYAGPERPSHPQPQAVDPGEEDSWLW